MGARMCVNTRMHILNLFTFWEGTQREIQAISIFQSKCMPKHLGLGLGIRIGRNPNS